MQNTNLEMLRDLRAFILLISPILSIECKLENLRKDNFENGKI